MAPVVTRPSLLIPSAAARRPRSTRARTLVAAAALCAAAVAAVMTLPYTSSTPAPPAGTVAPSSPTVPDTPHGYRRVHDPAGFTLDVPQGWRRTQRTDGIFYQSPGGKNLLQIIRITAPQETPYDTLKQADKQLSGNPGYKRIQLEKISSGDNAAAELEYTYHSTEYGPRRILDRVFAEGDGVQYAVVVAGPAGQRLEQRERQQVILGSFCPTSHCRK